MTYRNFKTFIATFAILGLGASASAQDAAAPEAAPAQDEATTQQHAVENIQLFYAALNSDQVSQDVKNTLVGCIYQNSMRQITVAMDKAIAANSTTIDRTDSSQMVGLMASICGYQPSAAGAATQPSGGR